MVRTLQNPKAAKDEMNAEEVAAAIHLRISSQTHLCITRHHSSKAAPSAIVSTISARVLRNVVLRRQQMHVEAEKIGPYTLLRLAEWKYLVS